MVRLCVAVITYRRASLLKLVLDSIALQTLQPSEVLVVDNADDPDVREFAESHEGIGKLITYFGLSENQGPAGGTAVAMKHFSSRYRDDDWLLRLDDDRLPPDEHLFADLVEFGTERIRITSKCGGVGLAGAQWDPRTATMSRVVVPAEASAVEVDYLATNWFSMFRRVAISTAGPMDPKLFFGMTEVEYGLRLRKHGFTLWLHGPRVYARRLSRQGAPTPSQRTKTLDSDADWRRYYSLRNSIYVARRYAGLRVALFVTFVRVLGKPLLNILLTPRRASKHLAIGMTASVDAWLGRMGKRIDPLDWEAHHGRLVDGEMPAT